jgi:hypothetical protein
MGELAFIVLQFFGELLLQIVLELLGELGLHSVKETFRRPEPLHPALAAIGYAILGAAAGGVSLLVVPTLLIDEQSVRIANLLLTPIGAGLFMAVIGSWRSRKGQEVIRLDKFSYGFLFALAMASVRFVWAHG